MENVKNWLLSKTIWGVIIMIVPNAKEIFADVTAKFASHDPVQIMQAVVAIIGVIMAVYGRFAAKKSLSFKIK